MRVRLVMTLACVAASSGPTAQHPHQGMLKKYDQVSPRRHGMSLRGVPNEDLRKGKPVVRRLPGARGRLMSVQDIHAPERVVWDTIMDVPNYPKFVDGCAETRVYARRPTATGGRVLKAYYRLRVPPAFKLEYYVTHAFEPLKHCMTFCLDYSRRSQLNDMVGYWYVEQLPGPDVWSRVYFSSDAMIPSWLSWAKDPLTRQAAYKNLYWVEENAHAAMGLSSRGGRGFAGRMLVGGAAVAIGARYAMRRTRQPLKPELAGLVQ